MGQKVNPTIFRLGINKEWKSRFIEKKTKELSHSAFNDFEIRNFIFNFCESNQIIISNLILNYSENTLFIFFEYYSNIEVTEINNKQTKLISKELKKSNSKNLKIKNRLLDILNHFHIKKNKIINKFVNKRKNVYVTLKKYLILHKKTFKKRRLKSMIACKYLNFIKKYKLMHSLKENTFFKSFFDSLKLFMRNKVNIVLTSRQLNKNLDKFLLKNKIKFIKNNLVKLRKYSQNNFFKLGVNMIFFSTLSKKPNAVLITNFISTQLKKLKHHNFFLRFIKSSLSFFIKKRIYNIKGIKIKIKGRLNGIPRAKHKEILIKNGIPSQKIYTNIDYSEKTAFTKNGSLGVKVWIYN